ncbi:ATPase [Brasilonema octagenarum UFV-E1]|uniref:histidine kinase n=1 Tax=Brasilonema sennae CENA114 TaxID=415709 RepID=A0A856MLI8_9CYAN|nr:ATP-binding protein [Brasilonema sennae]QDL10980.1 ATPase [Brasilonema sennae CENA114]QDL17326.1 ATPase [Brasilonema octagenarum UFV-E1]
MATTFVLTNQVFTNANDSKLGSELTLQHLQHWEVCFELSHPASNLIKCFEEEPLLPGVILTTNQLYVGMISRRRFFEKMSQNYSLDLYSQRPVETLYRILKQVVFTLDEETPIIQATQLVLQQAPEFLYEPILVTNASGKHRLIDFQTLLLAYSQIYVSTLAQLQQVEEQSKIASTNLRELEHKYNQSVKKEKNEKVAALRQLVTGIVEQINKPVIFIAGNLIHANRHIQKLLQLINLYQRYYPEPAAEIQTALKQTELDFLNTELPNLLTSIKSESQQMWQIVHSLQSFSYLDKSEKKAADIHDNIDSALLVLESRLKPYIHSQSITLVQKYGKLTLVECYVEPLKQVFINILTNAIDALEEKMKNSKSTVETKQKQNPQDQYPSLVIRIETQMSDSLTDVVIRIADNGSGMTEEVKQQIFQPFFSTKSISKKVGLGLFISYQIVVEKHGGQLDCISTLGEGTELIIKIPLSAQG